MKKTPGANSFNNLKIFNDFYPRKNHSHIKCVIFFIVGANILSVGKNTDKNVTFAFNGEPFVECLRFHEDM